MPVTVSGVEPGSPAFKKGLRAGDILLTVNKNEIEDVLDYRFFIGDAKLKISYLRDGKKRTAVIRKSEGEDIGLDFETYLMDKQHCCKNKCVFCFIDQLPGGLRDSLYFKDDDSRMSFLFGNYITLTNLTEHEVERIIRMHISPVNISVHTTDPDLRVKMMKNPHAGESLDIMYRLAKAGTAINCQIVVCPGLNDGDHLVKSIRDLAALYPSVQSIACVPVGLTKYRDRLEPLTPFDKDSAGATLDIIQAESDRCLSLYGQRIVYGSDEFYLMSGRELPGCEYYGEFAQLENGVGMCALLKDEFLRAVSDTEPDLDEHRCTVATGESAAPILTEMVDIAGKKWHNLKCDVIPIVNDFFGHGINVTGLITGQDLIAQLKGRDIGKRLLLSTSMFRSEGDIMLDGTSVSDIESALGVKVEQVPPGGYELLCAILEIQ